MSSFKPSRKQSVEAAGDLAEAVDVKLARSGSTVGMRLARWGGAVGVELVEV